VSCYLYSDDGIGPAAILSSPFWLTSWRWRAEGQQCGVNSPISAGSGPNTAFWSIICTGVGCQDHVLEKLTCAEVCDLLVVWQPADSAALDWDGAMCGGKGLAYRLQWHCGVFVAACAFSCMGPWSRSSERLMMVVIPWGWPFYMKRGRKYKQGIMCMRACPSEELGNVVLEDGVWQISTGSSSRAYFVWKNHILCDLQCCACADLPGLKYFFLAPPGTDGHFSSCGRFLN